MDWSHWSWYSWKWLTVTHWNCLCCTFWVGRAWWRDWLSKHLKRECAATTNWAGLGPLLGPGQVWPISPDRRFTVWSKFGRRSTLRRAKEAKLEAQRRQLEEMPQCHMEVPWVPCEWAIKPFSIIKWKHVEAYTCEYYTWVSWVAISWSHHCHMMSAALWAGCGICSGTKWDKKKQTSARWQCKCTAARQFHSFQSEEPLSFITEEPIHLATGCFYSWNFPGEPLGNFTQGWDTPQSFGQGWGDFGDLGDLRGDGNSKRLYRCFMVLSLCTCLIVSSHVQEQLQKAQTYLAKVLYAVQNIVQKCSKYWHLCFRKTCFGIKILSF